ncbi:hypothetical protein Tco_1431873 [Tanacetum coccineum]
MAESSSQNPSSPNLTPKEEPVTLDKPNSPNLFLPADHVEFTFDEMLFATNNEVARIHPDHPNSSYFHIVSDFISKCYLRKAFISAPTQYVEYLAEFWYTAKALENSRIWVLTPTGGIIGEIGITTFRNAIRAHYSDTYVDSPSLALVRPWFAEIGYNGEIKVKGTLKNSCLPLRWRLLIGQIIQCLGDLIHKLKKKSRERVIPYLRFISLLLEYMAPEYANDSCTINPTQIFSIHNWALKPNQPEEPPFTEHMLAVCNLAAPNVPKAPKPSSIAERVPQGTKPGAKPGHKKQSTSSKQPFVSSREETKGHDASADFIAEADPGISALKDSIS